MQQDNQIPERYLCSITSQIMIDPVMAADGHTYEREAIEQWLQTHDTSPKTNKKLENKKLLDNHDKRGEILEFLDNHPELYKRDEVYLPKSWMLQCVMAIKTNQQQETQRWLAKDIRLLTVKLENDSTALHLACEFSSPELVDALLKTLIQKSQPITPGALGFKPVHLNVLLQRTLDSVDHPKFLFLLKLGAEAHQLEIGTQNTLLHRLVIQNNEEPVSWLLEQRPELLEKRNKDGNTALLLSALQGKEAFAELLLKNGARIQVKNIKGETPVLVALLNQNKSMLSLLVGVEKAALSPLHLALEIDDVDALESLLKQNIGDLEGCDAQQRRPLYKAVQKGDLEESSLLLKYRANPAVCSAERFTLLHVAAERGHFAVLQLLLQTKAATLIDTRNLNGETACDLAIKAGQDRIVSLLSGGNIVQRFLEIGRASETKESKDGVEIVSGQNAGRLLTFSNGGKIKSVIDNNYELSESMWVVSIVNTKGNTLVSGHAVIVLEGIDLKECNLRLVVNEMGNFSNAIEVRDEIILVKVKNEFMIFCQSKINAEMDSFTCSKELNDLLSPLTPDGEILIRNQNSEEIYRRVYEEVASKRGYTYGKQRRFINQYDMTSNSPENMPNQSSFNEKGYITKIRCYEYEANRQDYSEPFPHRSYYILPEGAKNMIDAIKREAELTKIAVSNLSKPESQKQRDVHGNIIELLRYQKLGSSHPLVAMFGNTEHGQNCAGWCQEKMGVAAESAHKPKPPVKICVLQ